MKKRNVKKKFVKNATVLALGAGLISSSYGASYFASPTRANAASVTSAETILANLTDAQRQALKQLTTNDQSGLFVNDKVDLNSSEQTSVIVQFKQNPHKVAVLEAALKGNSLSDSQAKSLVDGDHATFKDDLQDMAKADNTTYKINREYKNTFNGVSLKLPANKIKSLLNSKAVKAVYSNTMVHVEEPATEATPSKEAKGSGMAAENSYLNINKLHDEGFTGKGIKVGVLDTGIDYNHPDLTTAYKGYHAQTGVDPKTVDPNSVKGWDFVDNDADPMETTYADWVKAGKPVADPSAYYTEHGTHVSGTIAGQGKNDSDYATNGVAPDADLYMYRVLGPGGGGSSDGIIAGIEKAVNDGMDVINLSLGANYNDPLFPTAIAINNAVLSGVTAVVAAGNAGNGMYTLGTPGNSSLALTVGASDVPNDVATMKGTLDNTKVDMRLMAKGFNDNINDLLTKQLPIVTVGTGQSFEYFGANARVDGKVVLIQRGTSTINDKILQAKLRGAAAVIIYNNNAAEGHLPFNLGEGNDFIPAFSLTNADGLALAQKVANTTNPVFSFSDLGKFTMSGDNLADFSSRGPSRLTYDIKPEITAPGVNVLSTVPGYVNSPNNPTDYKNAYLRMSGTSMATPFTSGVAALLLQAKPDLQPEDVKAILMNTADPLSKPYSVFEIGAGRVDPYSAIHSNFEIKVDEKAPTVINNKVKLINEKTGAISYGNMAATGSDLADTRTITLFNKAEKAKTFNVSVKFNINLRGSKDAAANGVTVKTDSSITLKGISQKKTNVTLTIPKSAEKGIYEGYINYTNKDNPAESYRVPFGVHYVEQGFNSFTLDRHSVPASTIQTSQMWNRGLIGTFNLKSHMRYVDIFVTDPKTGKDIGYLGYMDGIQLNEGVDISSYLYKGYYYPLTNDPSNPISSHTANPTEGQYQLKLVGTDDNGETYTVTQDFFADKTKPKWDMHVDGEKPNNPFVEFKDGQATLGLTANITDNNVAVKQAAGMQADQSQNQIYYSYNSPYVNGYLDINKDGNATDEIAMLPSQQILPVKFEGTDEASNGYIQKQYYFVNEKTPYIYGQPNVPTKLNRVLANEGDTIKVTLTANNVSKLTKVNYNFSTNTTNTEIKDISLNPEAQKFGGTLTVNKTTSGTNVKNDVNVTFDGSKEVSGDIPMVDVTIKIPDNVGPGWVSSFSFVSTKLTDVNNTVTQPFTYIAPIGILSKTTEVFGYIQAEALTDPILGVKTMDNTKINPTITVIDKNGTEVKSSTLDSRGQFDIKGIAPQMEDYKIIQDIPGHFTFYGTFNTQTEFDGDVSGFYQRLGTETLWPKETAAGDVNKDNVIDVMDALAFQTYWGTNKRSADINFDGVVDAKDFAFVEKNFGMQNPTIAAPPKPVKKYKGNTLESIMNQLSLD
ncbi:S8 family serine peptidase [Gottfriedia acidiceleris]|uniref:S8 family serine peptidase n=1 Tax=Gottfriedia acidiceleris TaxID=371036 RepID=UPI003D1CC8BD